jgi:hypothetical protein
MAGAVNISLKTEGEASPVGPITTDNGGYHRIADRLLVTGRNRPPSLSTNDSVGSVSVNTLCYWGL